MATPEERYNFRAVEAKWQKTWNEQGCFASSSQSDKPKYYVLEMFPYPSGKLHMGHVRNYTIGDVLTRYHRMKGYNVMQPMGWDAFGLPAENAAIKRGLMADVWTNENIKNMRVQLEKMGTMYDWDKAISTADPSYYKWTQWMFLQLYKNGLAYKKKAAANWCPKCKSVLANEQAEGGKCWRRQDGRCAKRNTT